MRKFFKTKAAKIQFFFISIMVCFSCNTLTAFAITGSFSNENSGTYSGVPKVVLDMVQTKSVSSNFFRNIEWGILKFIASVIDCIDNAITEVLKLNLYDFLSDAFNLSSMWTLIIAILSVSMIIGVMIMVIYHDKIHVSDFLMNLMVSCLLLIALPTFISATNTLRTKGVATAQSVEMKDDTKDSVVDDEGVVYKSTLGSDLLGQGVYDVYNSVINRDKTSFTEYIGSSAQITEININSVISQDDNQPWTKFEVTNSMEQNPTQKKYSELNDENMMELLGLSVEYSLLDSNEKFIISADYSSGSGDISYMVFSGKDYPNGYAMKENDYEDIYSAQIGTASPTSVKIGDLYFSDGSRYDKLSSYEVYVKDLIANSDPVRNAGLTQAVGAQTRTVTDALNLIKPTVIKELNIKSNDKIATSGEAYSGVGYSDKKLMSEEDYDDLNSVAQWFERTFASGSTQENLYYYHIDFLNTFILMLVVGLCLLFSAFKVGTTLFEIMFNQLITPFIIATDLHGSGRTKKAIQNFLLSNVILMIVILLLRVYISIIWGVRDTKASENFAFMLLVIVSGAKFVIDGPEILTKLFGIDAGTKSMAGSLMSINQAMQMGGQVAHIGGGIIKAGGGAAIGAGKGMGEGIKNMVQMPSSGGNAATRAADKVASGGMGVVGGTVAGAVGGMFGNTNAGANIADKMTGKPEGKAFSNSLANNGSGQKDNLSSKENNQSSSSEKSEGSAFSNSNNTDNSSSEKGSAFNQTSSSSKESGNAFSGGSAGRETSNNSSGTEKNSQGMGNGKNTSAGNNQGTGFTQPKDGSDGKDGMQGMRGVQGETGSRGDSGNSPAGSNNEQSSNNQSSGKGFKKE